MRFIHIFSHDLIDDVGLKIYFLHILSINRACERAFFPHCNGSMYNFFFDSKLVAVEAEMVRLGYNTKLAFIIDNLHCGR